jgi:hypothetical protein
MGADVGRLGQRLAHQLQGDADDGEVAAGPAGLLALLDGGIVGAAKGDWCRGSGIAHGFLLVPRSMLLTVEHQTARRGKWFTCRRHFAVCGATIPRP